MTNGASVLNGAMGMPTKLNRRLSLGDSSMTKKLKPVHPGEILREEFMLPLRLSMNRVAMDLRVPVTRIADIVNEKRAITADTGTRKSIATLFILSRKG